MYHIYADDTQLYAECPPSNNTDALRRLRDCVDDLKRWLDRNHLLLNESKTEAIVFRSAAARVTSVESTVDVCGAVVPLLPTIRDIGVILDNGLDIRQGAQMIATHDYKKNPESPVGNELDVNEGDTLVYLLTNENNEHRWLPEDGKGQVGYVPATYLKIIRDATRLEEESDTAGKEGYGKKTDGSKIGGDMGQDGERRKTYSAVVIEGFKRNSAIYVGDSIVRKTDSRLNKGEDVVVCLPGARIEHVTARVEKIMGRGKGGTILVHIGTNNADKEGTTAIVDKYSKLLKKTKEARVGQIILSGILPVFGNRIDGYRNSKRMAINGMVKRLCKEEDVGYVDLWDSFVGKEEMYLRDGLHLSGKGAAVFAEGLSGAVASGLGKVRYLN